jgi:uncharacterized membrane protein
MTTQNYGTATAAQTVGGAETNMRSVKQRYGGGDLVAATLGMLAGLGMLALIGVLLAAGAGGIDFQPNLIDADGNLETFEMVGSLVAIGAVFLSFLVGGFAAGRISRFDGGLNGLGSALLFVLLVAIFGALGAWVGSEYNAFAATDLPNWFAQFDASDVTWAAILVAVAGIAVACFAGYLGGAAGTAYNRKVDAAITQEALTA